VELAAVLVIGIVIGIAIMGEASARVGTKHKVGGKKSKRGR